MIANKMQEALNKQVTAEFYSAYLYLSMDAYFQSTNLPGFASWMRVQAQEELTHAMKIYGYINDRGGRVELKSIQAPPVQWKNPLEVFKAVLAHEQKVTGLLNDLANLAAAQKDNATVIFMQWFVSEQVEEEKSAGDAVGKLKLAGSNPGALLMLDSELGRRVFVPPVQEAGT